MLDLEPQTRGGIRSGIDKYAALFYRDFYEQHIPNSVVAYRAPTSGAKLTITIAVD